MFREGGNTATKSRLNGIIPTLLPQGIEGLPHLLHHLDCRRTITFVEENTKTIRTKTANKVPPPQMFPQNIRQILEQRLPCGNTKTFTELIKLVDIQKHVGHGLPQTPCPLKLLLDQNLQIDIAGKAPGLLASLTFIIIPPH